MRRGDVQENVPASHMTATTRRCFIAAIGGASALFAKSAGEKAFPNWSASYIDRMLTDSPWAKESTVSFRLDAVQKRFGSSFAQIGYPGGIGIPGTRIPGWPSGGGNTTSSPRTWPGGSGGGAKTEIYLVTRWSSALPIRRALALLEFGANGLSDEKAVELLTRKEPEYVVEIGGFPTTTIRQGARKLEAELLQSARLTVPNRKPVTASSAHVPEHGMHLAATLRFPRFEDLSPKEGTIELFAESGPIRIQERFKLRDMVYEGLLEL